MIKNIMFNYNHFQLRILNKYEFCHFIPALKAGEVEMAECFVKLYITIIPPIIAKAFLNERKHFLFLNLLLILEKNLSKRLFENSPFVNNPIRKCLTFESNNSFIADEMYSALSEIMRFGIFPVNFNANFSVIIHAFLSFVGDKNQDRTNLEVGSKTMNNLYLTPFILTIVSSICHTSADIERL